jgi:enediyne biosynthesis protein E4
MLKFWGHLASKMTLFALLTSLVFFLSRLYPNEIEDHVPQFVDVTTGSGIKFQHICGDPKRKNYIFEVKGGGVGFFDFDNDGWMDILLVQGSTLERFRQGNNPGPSLFRNKGNGTFEDVTQKAGLKSQAGWGMGVTFGDYDNDGFTDFYITCLGPNLLCHNNGDGTFTDITEKSGTAGFGKTKWSTSAAFGDYDQDGFLDLYVCNYLEMDFNNLPAPGSGPYCNYLGRPTSCGPKGIPGTADNLYRNNGDGTFTEMSEKAGGLDKKRYPGLGVVWADIDSDHDLDIYVANDGYPNYLFLNRGDGTFEERALLSGLALSGDARAQAGMGVDIADYDNDGQMDVFVTDFAGEYSTLYHNERNQVWEDVTLNAQLQKSYGLLVGWGTRFADFNNDGWKDIYHCNGHVASFLIDSDMRESYYQPSTFFLNGKDGKFIDVSTKTGPGIQTRKSSRGAAFADFDNDGDIDFMVANLNDAPQLFRNDRTDHNHWIMFKTVGRATNRDGIGARITALTGKLQQIWEIKTTVGIYSASDPRAHFGLGDYDKVDLVLVSWPSGKVQEFRNVAADSHYVIDEKGGLSKQIFRR